MKKPIYVAILLLIAVALFFYLTKSPNTKPTTPSIAETERAWTEDELHEIGEITNIEENGYPMFTITIVFHAGQPGFDLTANVEELGLGGTNIESLKGKMATVYYTSKDEPQLLDIQANGHSLLGNYAPEISDRPQFLVPLKSRVWGSYHSPEGIGGIYRTPAGSEFGRRCVA